MTPSAVIPRICNSQPSDLTAVMDHELVGQPRKSVRSKLYDGALRLVNASGALSKRNAAARQHAIQRLARILYCQGYCFERTLWSMSSQENAMTRNLRRPSHWDDIRNPPRWRSAGRTRPRPGGIDGYLRPIEHAGVTWPASRKSSARVDSPLLTVNDGRGPTCSSPSHQRPRTVQMRANSLDSEARVGLMDRFPTTSDVH